MNKVYSDFVWATVYKEYTILDKQKSQIQGRLNSGSYYIAGVIADNTFGALNGTKTTHENDVAHWVVITGISVEWDYDYTKKYDQNGDPLGSPWRWVRIYNPLKNRPEYYPLQVFQKSWFDNDHTLIQVDKINSRHHDHPGCQ